MKQIALLIGVLLLAAGFTSTAPVGGKGALPEAARKALGHIDVKDIKAHESYLTSAECAGRDTPNKGLEHAAEYISNMHQSFGLEGAGPQGSFRHSFEVPVVTYDAEDYLAINTGSRDQDLYLFKPGVDFVPVRGSPSGEVEGEVVFAGYGIYDSDERYNDFQGVSVKNKVVLVLSHEPRQNKRGRAFKGQEFTKHAAIDYKGVAAHKHGAKAVLVVLNPIHHQDLSLPNYELPRFARGDPPDNWGHEQPRVKPAEIPVLFISGKVAEALVGVDQLRDRQKALDKKMRGNPQLLEGVTVRLKCTVKADKKKVDNVVAMIRGSDPKLKDQWIIVGAHYDHLGADAFGRLYHGADDNASGTSCLLEVAQSLGQAGVSPRRSVLFISFAGEEDGLLGAKGYVADPLFPLKDTVAMINMDMVGRGRPNDVDAVGMHLSKDFQGLVKKAISESRTRIRVGKEGMMFWLRSDQFPFYEAGIPALFFMEPDTHSDYHKITDTPDKIDTKKVAKVARVVSSLIWLISEQERPVRAKNAKD